MNARDRGQLLFRLADLMDQHKEELATIESIGKKVALRLSGWGGGGGWVAK